MDIQMWRWKKLNGVALSNNREEVANLSMLRRLRKPIFTDH
jgi:hypothetical protein